MASLLGLLHLGASGLSANQAGAATSGNNVANARTPGFVRRDLRVDEGRGAAHGVRTLGVQRAEDFILSQKLALSAGDLAEKQLMAQGLKELESVLVAGGSSLSLKVTEFSRSFSELAVDPKDGVRRTDVLARAQGVADAFNRIAKEVGTVLDKGQKGAEALLPEINDLAQKIAELNQRTASGAGGIVAPDTAERARDLDTRDGMAQTLSGLVGGQILRNSDGTLDVLVGGLSLVHGREASVLQIGQTGQLLVGGAQVMGEITGEIAGHLQMARAASETLAQLDRLAYDVVTAVNAQHALGTGLDGVNGRGLFANLGAVAGSALSLKVDPRTTPTTVAAGLSAQPGDNRNALVLGNLLEQPVLLGGTANFRGAYGSLSSRLGGQVRAAQGALQVAEDRALSLSQAREAASGVSTDEEMVRLTAYQRGFEASAKFIKTIDEMLASLTQLA